MSHILPVAPPPPMPPQKPEIGPLIAIPAPVKNQMDECLWALDYPEIQKACYRARICQVTPPRHCQYRNIAGMLQDGPTCGLTALSMLLGGTPAPQQLLTLAREKRYTNNGEMFCALYLFQLICDYLQMPSACAVNTSNLTIANIQRGDTPEHARHLLSTECQMHEGRLNCAKVKECLLAGACLFVPYDPDYNHAPCLKMGHKAHWALIIGYLISSNDEFYVLARHGKAKNLAAWSLQALSDSNANLLEFAQPKGYPDCDFLLPPGGIGGDLGLRERAIIVQGLQQDIITVR